MKAMRFREYGGPEVLHIEDIADPPVGADQALVRVVGTSFNRVDAAARGGALRGILDLRLPYTTGLDVSGTIEALGPDFGADLAIGDPVLAYLPIPVGGAAAEYAIVPKDLLARAPRVAPLVDAAALPLVGLSAWQALHDHSDVGSAAHVLVNGAGGAVGGYVVQLAKHAGARVTAICGPDAVAHVRDLGADAVIDRTAAPLSAALAELTAEGVDIAVNFAPASSEDMQTLLDNVRDGGALVSGTTPVPTESGRRVRMTRMASRSDSAQLDRLVEMVDQGNLSIAVHERRPWSQLPDVHAQADAGTLRGKIVLEVS